MTELAGAFSTTTDGTWFTPTDASRGPWDPDACHGGPPAGLLARSVERLVSDQRLTRLNVDLIRPVPMAGFRIDAEIERRARTVTTTRARIVDGDGKLRASAAGLHLTTSDLGPVPTAERVGPRIAEKEAEGFALSGRLHDLPRFADSGIEVAYPPGEDRGPGPTSMWMRTAALLEGEELSPFQKVCPLADSGNGISSNASPTEYQFINADLSIVLHRDPVGTWIASSAESLWDATGVGLADAVLYDRIGAVGRVCQTLIIRPA